MPLKSAVIYADVSLLPTPAQFGVGSADVAGVLYWSDGATWTSINNMVGQFATASALQAAYPAASNNTAYALVGSAVPYALYYSNGNSWSQANSGSGSTVTVAGLSTSAANAATNTALINAAVANGGSITIAKPLNNSGNYLVPISAPIILPSNTSIEIKEGVTLQAVPTAGNANKFFNFFQNSLVFATKSAVQQLGASELVQSPNDTKGHFGYRVGVKYDTLAHFNADFPTGSVVAGDHIEVWGDCTLFINGIWEVDSLDTVNRIVYFLLYPATNATINSIANSPVLPWNDGVTTSATTTLNTSVTIAGCTVSGSSVQVPTGTVNTVYPGMQLTSINGVNVASSNIFITEYNQINLSGTSYFVLNQVPGNQATVSVTFAMPIYVCKANANISIIGRGKLDGNFNNGQFIENQSNLDHGIQINHCLRPIIGNGLKITDTAQFCIVVAHAQDAICRELTLFNGKDGIHYLSPMFGLPLIENISGSTGDDSVTFEIAPNSNYLAYWPQDSGSSSFYHGGLMRNIKMHNSGNTGICGIYSSGGNTNLDIGCRFFGSYKVQDVSILTNINGDAGSGVQGGAAFFLNGAYAQTSSVIDSLELDGITGTVVLGGIPTTNPSASVCTIRNLKINRLNTFHNGNVTALTFSNVAIDAMIVDDFQWSSSGSAAIQCNAVNFNSSSQGSVALGSVTFNAPRVQKKGPNDATFLYSASSTNTTIQSITVNNPFFDAGQVHLVAATTALSSNSINFLLNNFQNMNTNHGVSIWGTNAQSGNVVVNGGSFATGNPTVFQIGGTATGQWTFQFNGCQVPANSSALFNFSSTGAGCNIYVSGSGMFVPTNSSLFTATAQPNLHLVDFKTARPTQRANLTATAQTVTTPNLTGYNVLNIVPNAAYAAATLALPANPMDGEILKLRCTQAITALTLTGGTIAGITSGTTGLSAGYSRELIYSSADTLWA